MVETLKLSNELIVSENSILNQTIQTNNIELPRDNTYKNITQKIEADRHMESIAKETSQIIAENKELKHDIMDLMNKSKERIAEIAKLQEIIKNLKKIIADLKSGRTTNRKDELTVNCSGTFERSNKSPLRKLDYKTQIKEMEMILEYIKNAPNIANIISLFIKYVIIYIYRKIPILLDCEKICIFIFDSSLSIIDPLKNSKTDSHCKFHKVPCFKSFTEIIHNDSGYSKASFSSLEYIGKGLRTYISKQL